MILLSRRRALLAILLAAASLGGCSAIPSVGPDITPPAFRLPAFWRGSVADQPPPAGREQRLAQWWRQLGDPRLDRLIQQALDGSPNLRLVQARLRQSRALRSQAAGGFFPTVGGAFGVGRTSSATASSPTRTVWEGGFDATWEIDIFGGTRRAVEAAEADLAAAAADADDARVSLVAEVAQTYVDLRSYGRRLAIARDNLSSQAETLQITQWRRQAGLATDSEVEQARANLEQTRAGIPDIEVGGAQAENRLAVLLGLNPGGVAVGEGRLPQVPASLAVGIPADILRQRPDLVAAERRLAAETARVGQALAQRFPGLDLSGSFGWQSASLGALGGAGTLVRAAAGSLVATLFDGGRLRAAVAAQEAVRDEALVSYETSVLTALEEVDNALASHAAARQRLDARRAAAEAARNAARLTRGLYESGLADFQPVLDTQRTQLTAEDNLALAEASQLSSVIQLYKVLGGGWEAPRNEVSGDDANEPD